MSGELQILLLILLSIAVGAVALIYYLRFRGRASRAEPAPGLGGSTSRDRRVTEAKQKRDVPLSLVPDSREKAAATPDVSGGEAEQSTAPVGEREAVSVLDGSAPRAEPGLRPGEGAGDEELSSAPAQKPREAPPNADHPLKLDTPPHEERSGVGTGPPESTLLGAEADEVSTPVIPQTAKEVATDVENAAAHTGEPHIDILSSEADPRVPSGMPGPGVRSDEARSAEMTAPPEIKDDHVPAGARDERPRSSAESATLAASDEEAISSDIAALSGNNVVATEGQDKGQPVGEEQPPNAPDQDEIVSARDGLVPERTLEMLAVQRVAETENVVSPSEQAEVVVDGDESRNVSEEPDRVPEEGTDPETAVPNDPSGVEGVNTTVCPISDLDSEETPGPTTEDDECDSVEGKEQGVNAASITQAPRRGATRKKPRKYKGIARAAPQPRDAELQAARAGGEEPAQRERALPIEIRMRFDRGGFCSVSLIAKRSAGLPEDLTAATHAGEVTLRAMQEEWYQDVVPDDLSRVLQDGTVWTLEGANGQSTWSLSGRTLYVLADRSDISGYVSQPCLDLGREHVVLCSASLRSRVEDAIRETGAPPPTVLDESLGTPPGWVVFRDVVPNTPVAPASEADIFNALRPLPQIEISLERGIRFAHADWLDGHPPLIRVYGDPQHAAEVRIDGQVAKPGADGAYRASGWDSLGTHTVWCSGISRSYSIAPFDASWKLWEGYAFPVATGEKRRLTVCGPIVRVAASDPCCAGASISVPESNAVLLGREPGQVAVAVRASSLGGAPCIATPCFRPVWALPRDPLHCDKKTIRILLVAGTDAAVASKEPSGGRIIGASASAGRWGRLILDASRKGMKTEPDTESVRALWLSYKRLARGIWRAHR